MWRWNWIDCCITTNRAVHACTCAQESTNKTTHEQEQWKEPVSVPALDSLSGFSGCSVCSHVGRVERGLQLSLHRVVCQTICVHMLNAKLITFSKACWLHVSGLHTELHWPGLVLLVCWFRVVAFQINVAATQRTCCSHLPDRASKWTEDGGNSRKGLKANGFVQDDLERLWN